MIGFVTWPTFCSSILFIKRWPSDKANHSCVLAVIIIKLQESDKANHSCVLAVIIIKLQESLL